MAEPDKTASPAGAAAATAVPPVPSDAPEQKQPESSLQQPSDAVEMTTVEAGSAKDGDHHHHHNDAATATGGADEPSSASVKGKEKETPAEEKTASGLEAETEPKRDSLSITRTDEHGVSSPSDGPVCNITLLLPTGARHPYKIDERYLSKRSVDIPETNDEGRKDPFSISVYKLKELILREWRPEWEAKPASPSSIRLIHFGKLLDDKEQLKKYQFSAESPNVVHMSVRPAEMMEEDEAAKGKSSGREGRNRDGSSNCCIIL